MINGVAVIIKKDEKYLMMQQPETKHCALQWMPISGGIEQRETPEQAVIRETKEETGLEIEIIDNIATLPGDYKRKDVYFFIANRKNGEINPRPEEIKNIKQFGWFTHEEILKLDLMGASKEFFENHFKPF